MVRTSPRATSPASSSKPRLERGEPAVDDAPDQQADQGTERGEHGPDVAADRTSREAHEHGRTECCRTDRVPASAGGRLWFLRGFMAGAGLDPQFTAGARARLEWCHELGLLFIRQVIDKPDELIARGHCQRTGLCRARCKRAQL